jgi:hypothetical protein
MVTASGSVDQLIQFMVGKLFVQTPLHEIHQDMQYATRGSRAARHLCCVAGKGIVPFPQNICHLFSSRKYGGGVKYMK